MSIREEMEQWKQKLERCTLQVERGATCRGVQMASRSWKGKDIDPLPEPAEE